MDISVIMPIYNGAEYMKKAIDSVLQQKGVEWELFLVDDGSTDETPKLCDQLAEEDTRIRVIHKENAGPGIARNAALDKAVGKYIFFLDCDDWLVDGCLAYLFELAEKNEVDIVSYGVHKTEDRNAVVPWRTDDNIQILEGDDILRRYFTKMSASICKMFRREIFSKYRFEKKAISEDAWSMHLFFSEANRIAICKNPCYVQYIRPQSRSRSDFSQRNFIVVDCGKRMVQFAKENRPQVYGEALYNLIKRQLRMLFDINLNNVYRTFKKEYWDILHDLKSEKEDAKHYKYINEEAWKLLCMAVEHPYLYRCREQIKSLYYKWK